jgi:undecaprenyl pyrophosphate synthase
MALTPAGKGVTFAANARTGERPPVPRHVAVIMDGHGRWAQRQGLPRLGLLGG